jgi:hypothetical protein
MTRAEEDALLSDLAEADRHVRDVRNWEWHIREMRTDQPDRVYLARLLRHALQIVEGEKP